MLGRHHGLRRVCGRCAAGSRCVVRGCSRVHAGHTAPRIDKNLETVVNKVPRQDFSIIFRFARSARSARSSRSARIASLFMLFLFFRYASRAVAHQNQTCVIQIADSTCALYKNTSMLLYFLNQNRICDIWFTYIFNIYNDIYVFLLYTTACNVS